MSLIKIKDLKVYYKDNIGYTKAVDGVDLTVEKGETLCIAGESGSGKSTLCHAVLKLIPTTEGNITFKNIDITHMPERKFRRMRKQIQLVFQDSSFSQDPRLTVEDIIKEPLKIFNIVHEHDMNCEIKKLLNMVGISSREMYKFPYELSGGQRQRISIARAIASRPELIILDEPVSSLDVSIQSQILNLLIDLKKEINTTYIFVTHELNVVYYICTKVAVMYLGKILEIGDKSDIFKNPSHPYTKALMSASDLSKTNGRIILKGEASSYNENACSFYLRCNERCDRCLEIMPELTQIDGNHFLRCLKDKN